MFFAEHTQVHRRMTPDQARRHFAQARVARRATADAGGRPHLVPMVFAWPMVFALASRRQLNSPAWMSRKTLAGA